jgi:hypothetical protein
LKVKPNSKTFGNVQKAAEEEHANKTNVIEKAVSIFQQCTENYRSHAKMFNVGEADFFACN